MKRTKKVLILVGIVLVIFYCAYLAAANVYLNSDNLRRQINRTSSKNTITYRRAYSFIPLFYSVNDMHLVHQGRTSYQVSAEKASFWIMPFSLLNRKVEIRGCTLTGVEYSTTSASYKKKTRSALTTEPDDIDLNGPGTGMKKRNRAAQSEKQGKKAGRQVWRDFPAKKTPHNNVPAHKTELISAEENHHSPKKKGDWDFSIINARLRDIRSITYDNYRLDAFGYGSVTVIKKGELMAIPKGKIVFKNGKVRDITEKHVVFQDFNLKVDYRLKPMRFKKVKGKERLAYLKAKVTIKKTLCSDLSFLEVYLKKSAAVTISGGSGALEGTIQVAEGNFVPGSTLTYTSDDLEVSSLDDTFRGDGTVSWMIKEKNDQAHWELSVRFSRFELFRDERMHVFGKNNLVRLWGPELNIGQPIQDFSASFLIDRATLPDLSFYNTYMPDNSDLVIKKGKGTFSSSLLLSDKNTLQKGTISLNTAHNEFFFGDLVLIGEMNLTTRLGRSSLQDYDINLLPTSLELKNITIRNNSKLISKDWWGTFSVLKGRVTPKAEQTVDAEFTIETRDLWPVLYMYLNIKDVLPDYLARSLRIPLTHGHGHMVLTKDFVEFDRFHLEGKKLSFDAMFRNQDKKLYGALLLVYEFNSRNKIRIGIELNDKKQKVILEKVREWFRNYSLPPRKSKEKT